MKSERKEDKGISAVKTLIFAAVLALLFRAFAFEPFNIPSGSMIPTLKVGDFLFVSKFSYGYSRFSFPFGIFNFQGRILESAPERGDVVVFRQPNNDSVSFIKRVIGLPGDSIAVRDGILLINETPVTRIDVGRGTTSRGQIVLTYREFEEILPGGESHLIREMTDAGFNDNTRIFGVPQGHYFMMGDNRDNSNDSRTSLVGMVPAENLVGKAQFLFFSHNGSARIWEVWKWPLAIRYSRLGNLIN